MSKLRCAIYTRESTEEGLEMEFNTLDAQRESAENYISSQRHEGWSIIPTRYDDGGFSGGNINRPSFKRLMQDIENGLVDMIVVYKIDRLTRSLTDFSKIVEIFDKHNVSFVSVTQQFNTSTSMGRLTLNMLLSFAQFEREVSGERIRDKIAASKKKGMFMGGKPPLGYDIDNRKLVVNKKEAKIVEELFKQFIESQSYKQTARYLNALGYKTKEWTSRSGVHYPSKDFDFQQVRTILKNSIYIGKVSHKEETYEGLQEAIVDIKIWDEVAAILDKPYNQRDIVKFGKEEPLLKGILFCGCCNSQMLTAYTKKKTAIYRYYISYNAKRLGYENCEIGCIPAEKIEGLVIDKIKEVISSPEVISQTYKEVVSLNKKADEELFIRRMKKLESIWEYLYPAEVNQIVKLLIKRVVIYTDKIDIKIDISGLYSKLKEFSE